MELEHQQIEKEHHLNQTSFQMCIFQGAIHKMFDHPSPNLFPTNNEGLNQITSLIQSFYILIRLHQN